MMNWGSDMSAKCTGFRATLRYKRRTASRSWLATWLHKLSPYGAVLILTMLATGALAQGPRVGSTPPPEAMAALSPAGVWTYLNTDANGNLYTSGSPSIGPPVGLTPPPMALAAFSPSLGTWVYLTVDASGNLNVNGGAAGTPTFVSTMIGQSGTEGRQVFLIPNNTSAPNGLYFYHSGAWHFSGGPIVTATGTLVVLTPVTTSYEVDWDVILGTGLTLTPSTAVVSVSFPTLSRIGFNTDLYTSGLTSLTSISIPENLSLEGNNSLNFNIDALSAANVNAIMHQLLSATAIAGPQLFVDQQTPPAVPYGEGILDFATLTAAGWTITTDQFNISITALVQLTKTFTVAGNQMQYFPATSKPQIQGSTGNDGVYTVVSATFAAGVTNIVVVEAIPSPVADGLLAGPL